MEFISEELDNYICAHTSPESKLLYELNRETHLKVLQPRMLSGHFQGRLLSMISKMVRPKRILEIGTYTGYSALCLLEGLEESGELITIDVNEELEDIIRKYLNKAGVEDQVQFMIGDALELIPTIDGNFDLVFIDADKSQYLDYYELVIERMNPGAYLLTDNVLWSGKVLDPTQKDDPDTRVIMELNDRIMSDERVETILLPIRDGLMLTRKKD
ncbi:MAG: O-methyltransferase [Bacteroidetes bacterium]|nr:MAG: O-methyltransferase [Bacteroidota bacterium]